MPARPGYLHTRNLAGVGVQETTMPTGTPLWISALPLIGVIIVWIVLYSFRRR
jgi:hypothetical protein